MADDKKAPRKPRRPTKGQLRVVAIDSTQRRLVLVDNTVSDNDALQRVSAGEGVEIAPPNRYTTRVGVKVVADALTETMRMQMEQAVNKEGDGE